MADESTDYSNVLSRRRFVELTGVTGAAALAGCDGDGGTPTEEQTDPPEESPEPGDTTEPPEEQPTEDVEHVGATTVSNPANLQFNPFNSSDSPEVSDRMLFERWAQYNFAQGQFVPAGLSEWEHSGDTFEMTLRDGLTWSDGEPVTADDIVLQLQLAEYDEDPVWEWAESVEASDDSTVVITIGDDVNPALIETDLFTGRFIKTDQQTYSSYLEDLDGGGDVSELRNFADTEPVTNGPFTLASKNDQAISTQHVGLSDSADHPDAQNINFSDYVFEVGGGNQQRMAALNSLSRDSDFSLAVPARVVAGFPDAIEEVTFPDVWGFGLAPNHNDTYAGDRAVRQAMGHAINRQQCVNNSLPRAKRAPTVLTGISDVANNQTTWLGEDNIDNYESYGIDSVQTEQVTSVMEDGGYSQVDGTWEDGSGNTVSLDITVPGAWTDWVDVAETIVANLDSAGFDATLVSTGSYFDVISSGDFQFVANSWLDGGPTAYPYNGLLHNLRQPQIHNAMTNYPAYTEQWGGTGDTEVTVPAIDGSGDTTVDVEAQLNNLATSNDDGEIQSIIRELAWVCNQDLPRIPIADKIFQSWLTNDEWNVPQNAQEVEEARVAFAPTWLPRKGMMNYTGGN